MTWIGNSNIKNVKSIRAYLHIEVDSPITWYTGKLVKTLLFSIFKEIRLYRGVKGIISPIHISPLFRPGKRDWELGNVVTPEYIKAGGKEKLLPVSVNGEYIIHLGGYAELVEKAEKALLNLRTPLQVKIGENIVVCKLESIHDVTTDILSKRLENDRATLYIKAPTKLFNVYVPSKLPKFNISAIEVLMVPYMLLIGELTVTQHLLMNAMPILGRIIETWYSINTVRTALIPFNNRKTPVLTGKITYIMQDSSIYREIFNNVINLAELAGIGQSRQNGFGTVAWTQK